ncbi:Uncharacterised protein [Mycobacterium tuberculosis]|nr:Uncharacterised protein [Mycobacterium tuberculosis]CNM36797.1 Uncharacterised protein [Mycobacterium tuberculosis]CNM98244.1 Uncharacterised protein [Mycobacterium tuberculosis]CNN36836.1 Uncharacterised protein [Mycobacterium tuberculosis]
MPVGLSTLSSIIHPAAMATNTIDNASAAVCLRSSCFMRTENRVVAARSRRL